MTISTDCPKCECNDTQQVKIENRFGQECQRRRCNHCNHSWIQPTQEDELETLSDDEVWYEKTPCLHCNSTNNYVTQTRGNVRHHKCKECGRTFKSRERTAKNS